MADHPIQGLMKTTLENLKHMVDVNTIIGEPVETPDGSVILPVSRVAFGFASGGSEFEYSHGNTAAISHPFGGGSGGGVSITPVAFLIVGKQGIRSIPLENSTHLYDRILDSVPQVVEKVQQMIGRNDHVKAEIITDPSEQDLDELMERS
ncbi:sporulation protein YtfJ [Brevibacillus sp. SYP-B805]|uniref:GerW family sporulation protein n=1 Tax=Brevibacillus sp. SYP-B805 TaxID=1578199 RepID=UPI0013EE2C04|nr:GerW family sporulation protein [Brevibacillus sp. SYP-B805]NGQ95342.1 sporulation protein YtfJ [Brevibacillus sp. SYP-B805]